MATADTTIARRRPGATGRRVRRIGARTLLYVVAWVAAIATLVPILYAILGGFRDTGQLSTNPVALPDPWVFTNYSSILRSSTFWHQVWNSVLIALISTALTVPIAAMAAFVFARFAFRGREVFYTIFTLGLLFPVAIAILPIFIMVRNLGLLDNPLGVALPQAAFGLPITIIILRPFFHSIPSDLQDAAAIDGCGPFALLRADPAAALAPGAGDRLGAGDRRQLERLPAAAGRAHRLRRLDAAPGRDQLLPAVHDRHRARSWPSRRCRWCRRSSSTRSPSASSSRA